MLFGALQALVGVSALPAPSGGPVTDTVPSAVPVTATIPSGAPVTATGTKAHSAAVSGPAPSGISNNGTAPVTAGGKRRIGYYDAFDWARAAKPELKIEALDFKPEIELKGLTHVILGKARMIMVRKRLRFDLRRSFVHP